MTSLQQLIVEFKRLLGYVPVVIIGFAVVFFFYKLVVGMQSDNDKTRKETRSLIGYAVVTLFVMLFLWGIVKTVQDMFFPGAFIQQLGK